MSRNLGFSEKEPSSIVCQEERVHFYETKEKELSYEKYPSNEHCWQLAGSSRQEPSSSIVTERDDEKMSLRLEGWYSIEDIEQQSSLLKYLRTKIDEESKLASFVAENTKCHDFFTK